MITRVLNIIRGGLY